MKRYRVLISTVVALALLVVSTGVLYAQGPYGDPDDCPLYDGTTSQMQQRQAQQAAGPRQANQYGNNAEGQFQSHMHGRNAGSPGSEAKGQWGQGMGPSGANPLWNLPPATPGELSQEVIDAMTAGIMDEYNAYGTYAAVIDEFGNVRPFTNILRAEAQHIDAWTAIFERYGVDVPAAPESVDLPDFATVGDACQAAADAEIANFGLYDELLDTLQDYPDMVQVVTALRNASELQHLPAFQNCASVAQ